MNRAKGILGSLRFVKSLLLTRSSATRSLHSQVTQYSHISPCFSSSRLKLSISYNSFNTKPDSLVELVSASQSSDELEQELGKSHPTPNYETVIYVLTKLEKNPKKAYDFYNCVYDKNGFKHIIPVYNLALKILAQNESLEEFWTLIKKLVDEGHTIHKKTYQLLYGIFVNRKMGNEIHMLKKMVGASSKDATLKTVVKLILGSDWNDEVKLKLSDLKLSLSDNSVVSILSEFCKYPFKALEFFYWVQESQDFKHSAVTYNGIVWVLGKEESIEKFWILVKEMKSLGYDIDLETYRKVAKEFFVNQLVRSNKLIKDAVDLYELMMDSPYKPPIEYCSKLLRKISLLETPDLSLVDRVIKKSNEARDSFSKTEYDMVHRSFINAGKFDEAEKVLETMRNAGYAPDNFTLCQIVFGLFKAGKVEEACNKFDEMEAQGCVPDLRTRATLIQGLCSAGEVDKALACLMKTQKTYSGSVSEVVKLLVDHLCPNDKADIAYAFVVKMAEKTDFRPSRFTYETLIKKLLEEGKLEEAFNLLGMVINDSSQPILRPFISYISEKGTVDSAQELLKALSLEHVKRTLEKFPDHIRYDPEIVSAFGSSKDSAAAKSAPGTDSVTATAPGTDSVTATDPATAAVAV